MDLQLIFFLYVVLIFYTSHKFVQFFFFVQFIFRPGVVASEKSGVLWS